MTTDADIHFTCSNGHKLRVKPDLAGKRIRCPNKSCGLVVEVPALAEDTPSEGEPDDERAKKRKKRRARASSHGWGSWHLFRWGILVFIGATGLFLLAVVALDMGLFVGLTQRPDRQAAEIVAGGVVYSSFGYVFVAAVGYVLCAFVPHPKRARAWLAASALCCASAAVVARTVDEFKVTLLTVVILAFLSWLLFLRFLSDVAAANNGHWLFTNLRSSQRWGIMTAILFIVILLARFYVSWEDAPTPLPFFGLYGIPIVFGLVIIGKGFVFYSYIRTLLLSRQLEAD